MLEKEDANGAIYIRDDGSIAIICGFCGQRTSYDSSYIAPESGETP